MNNTSITDSLQSILNGGQTPVEKKKTTGSNELGMNEFLQLFVAQLKYQDPLEPMENSDLTSQTSQFSMVDQLVKIGENTTKLVDGGSSATDMNLLFSASGFIGKMVEFEGNSIVFDGETGLINFDLEAGSYKTDVLVYDSSGNVVNTVDAGSLPAGRNSIAWNGLNTEGEVVKAGQYKVVVNAYDVNGTVVSSTTYGNGYVSGVSQQNGKIVFDLFGSEIEADKVTSVRSY
jgi:flagellar basal-body rod modification protein FlgD